MEIEVIKRRVNEVIREVLKDRFPTEGVVSDKSIIADYGAESVEVLEIFLTLMADFDVEFDRTQLAQLENMGAIYSYIQGLVNNRA